MWAICVQICPKSARLEIYIYIYIYLYMCLLPTESEEREVLGVRSIPVAMLPSCQGMNIILHKH